MERISVVGSSGSGKTTMAKALSDTLHLPRIELDAIYHQPNWEPLAEPLFRGRVAEVVADDRWVIDGNYTSHGVNDIVWTRADTVVWMDLSRPVVTTRVTKRAIHRAATKQELWNGNTESWSNLTKWDPHENIVRWSWTRFASTRSKYEAKIADPQWSHLEVFRLQSRREAESFLARLRAGDR